MDLLNTKCTYQNWSNYEVKGIVFQTAKSIQNLGPQFQGLGANYKVNSGNSVRFIFWGSKITADGDCSREIKDTYSMEEKL